MPQYRMVKVNDLFPYINNSRTHTDEQINLVADSIKEFGFLNPVLIDSDNSLIAGHCRLAAARKLDIEEVPVLVIDHLTEAQKKAYVIADNQLAINGSGWDLDILKAEVDALIELEFETDLLGFDDDFLGDLLSEIKPSNEDDQGALDEIEPKFIACPHCGKEFDSRQV